MGKMKLGGRWQKAVIAAAAALALTAGFVPPAQSQSEFEWVCDDPTCNGDPGFGFTITFAAGVAAPSLKTQIVEQATRRQTQAPQ